MLKMNLSAKGLSALYFVGGALLGAIPTFFLTKKYYKDYYKNLEEEKVDALTKAYCDAIDNGYSFDDAEDSDESDEENEADIKEPEAYILKDHTSVDSDTVRPSATKDIFLREVQGKSERVDYTKYQKKDYQDYIEPGPTEGEFREEEEDGTTLDILGKRVKKTKRPRIIKEEEYGMVAGYTDTELFFYKGDGVLTGEDDADIVDNPEILIGDALTKYGFFEDETKTIYVRNDSISTDFCITKIDGSYSDAV